jgi:hypothetical protein
MFSYDKAESKLYDLIDGSGLCRAEFRDKHKLTKHFGVASHEIDPTDLFRSLDIFNIGESTFFNDEYCDETAINFYNGDLSLGKNCIGNKGSRIRTIRNILTFLNPREREYILKHLQLSEEHLKNDDLKVGFHLSSKALDYVYERKKDFMSPYRVGLHNGISYLNGSFGESLQEFSKKEAIELFISEHAPIVEENRIYSISKLTHNRVIIKMTEKDEVRETLLRNPYLAESWRRAISGFFDVLASKMNQSCDLPFTRFAQSNIIEIALN